VGGLGWKIEVDPKTAGAVSVVTICLRPVLNVLSSSTDPSMRKVTVQVRIVATHTLFGKKETRDPQTWVLRQGEWYLVTEPLGPPRDRDREPKK